ncbi:hypothetical protein NBRC116590_18400 [Pelagimonas sp. KU-00592-HH]|uniref:helix-turn-helix transcriptional regulator n=1 Tax=Pelagimonas sp. KU-00592-HH TaxID=3127651 RepID=UPI0031024AE6
MTELNALIDLIDDFANGADFDARWRLANEAVQRLGGMAVNIGEFDTTTQEIKWLTSTMSTEWMDRYMERAYFDADEILDHCVKSNEVIRIETGLKMPENRFCPVEVALDHDLHDFGYRGFMAQALTTGVQDRLAVSMVMNHAPRALELPEADAHFKRMAAVIAAFIGRPDTSGDVEVYYPKQRRLTPRERDVLSLLANGHQYARIAERLGLAEITVRTHVQTARAKLRASTREQAVAIAVRDRLISI